jgi:nitrogen regulatory protein PII 1
MKMIKAILRPEIYHQVLSALDQAGFGSSSRLSVLGRGKQRGLKVGSMYYDEIPKEEILIVGQDEEVHAITEIIIQQARTGTEGTFGDGKIFILPVERAITISSGKEEL